MRNAIKQMATGVDGQTLDPARVIGYGSAVFGIATFIFNSIWSVTHTGTFDAQSYGIGLGAVFAGIMAIGIGVGVKAGAEPSPGAGMVTSTTTTTSEVSVPAAVVTATAPPAPTAEGATNG